MKDNSNRKAKRGRLARVTILRELLLAGVLVLGIWLTVGQAVREESQDVYRSFAQSYSRIIANNVEGDKVPGYLENKVIDEYYIRIFDIMQAMVDNANLRYLYVFVPEEQGIRYVWDSRSDDDSRPLGNIWYYEGNYPKDKVLDAYANDEEYSYVYQYDKMSLSGYITPLHDSSGNVVALVEADILMPYADLLFSRLFILIIVSVIIVLILAMIPFYYFTKRRIITPLEKLNKATSMMVEQIDEEEDIEIDIHTGDEIEIVSNSMETMNRRLKEYVKENEAITAERERVTAEIDAASKIQLALLPKISEDILSRTEFDIYADMTAAKHVGGDLYDYFLIDDNHLAIAVGDVSGKGISAALFMVLAKTTLQNQLMLYGEDIVTAISETNKLLIRDNAAEMFVSVWVGVIALDIGVLKFVDAGHECAAISKKGRDFVVERDNHSLVLGMIDEVEFMLNEIKLDKGDTLYIYTDGVVEARDTDENMFRKERMLSALNENPKLSPEELDKAVRKKVSEFTDDKEQFDDITTLCVRYYG